MPRADGRQPDELRAVTITRHFLKYAEGSVLITLGDTKVVCSASIEERVPHWMRGGGRGWISAEYGMLPRATSERTSRDIGRPSGRTQEIQRLVGRSLRAAVDLDKLGERTIWIDCDVIQADGGTRTAAITGSWVAVNDAVAAGIDNGTITADPIVDHCAAVSVGMVAGVPTLDLAYEQDSGADTDMNVVMTGSGGIVEIQGTAERAPFTRAQLGELLDLATLGINRLFAAQREALGR